MMDPCSYSNVSDAVVVHYNWFLSPDFSSKSISSTIDLTVNIKTENTQKLILDVRDLVILSVYETNTDQQLPFEVGPVHSVCETFGAPLTITLPQNKGQRDGVVNVSIKYKTKPSGTAVQWLDPIQTAGKQHPYLYTQCEAIHARSLLPCQDTPGVKSTYNAEVSISEDLNVVMGAVRVGMAESSDGRKTCKFSQKVPIPSYLVALAVGAIESRRIGPRSHVWSEKEFVDKAAAEFDEMERMIKVAEGIVGPYVWGESCDILVAPPSFPFGGMENPNMIFVTPTLLAGDKSLVTVIAHEISHSWTGNLVTNLNWEHFWLNEGFTRYLERLIVLEIHGNVESTLQLMLGWKSLQDSISNYGPTSPLTALLPKLGYVDPDEAFSSVPYEKGCGLLCYLESILGLNEMKGFLRAYIDHFKYKSLDTAMFKEFFLKYFESKKELLAQVDWEVWFHQPGMPPYDPQFDSSANGPCILLANRWSGETDGDIPTSTVEYDSLSSSQKQEFLNQLLNKNPLSKETLVAMERLYQLNSSTNDEITFRWLRLCLKGELTECFPFVTKFIVKQGRMKFTRTLYRELFNCPGGGKETALDTFNANRSIYHALLVMMVSRDLGLQSSTE